METSGFQVLKTIIFFIVFVDKKLSFLTQQMHLEKIAH